MALVCSLSIFTGALAALFSVSPAGAADTVNVGATDVQKAFWVAGALDRLKTEAPGVKKTFYIKTLTNMYSANPNLEPSAATVQLEALVAAVESEPQAPLAGLRGNQVVSDVLALVQAALPKVNPEHRAVIQAARQAYNYLAGDTTGSSFANDKITAAADLAVEASVVARTQAEVLNGAVDRVDDPGSERFKGAFDAVFAKEGLTLTIEGGCIVGPDCDLRHRLEQYVGPDGSVTATLADLRALMQEQFATIREQWTAAQADLLAIRDSQSNLLAYLDDSAEAAAARQRIADARAARSAEQQEWLSAGKSAVHVLSTLVGFADPKLGHQLAVMGNAAADMTMAVVKFADLASELGGVVNALTSAGGAALTGNFIGAALSIVTLFLPEEPKPEQIILDQIGQLQSQVAGLGTAMMSRFDQVDHALNTIYSGMLTQFRQIDVQLGAIRNEVGRVQESLIELRNQLTAIETNIHEVIRDDARAGYWAAVDNYLGSPDRTGTPLSFDDYLDADSLFLTWARQNAFNTVATGPTVREYGDDYLAEELQKFPLDVNAKYLAQLPAQWGLGPLVPHAVPNHRDWYLAARAYHTLNFDSPADAGRNLRVADEARELASLGRSYQNLERAAVGGARDGNGLNPLFATLLGRYRAKTDQVEAEIVKVENRFKGERKIDPFAGVDQPIPPERKATFGNIPFCGASIDGTRPLGPAAVDAVMPSPMQIVQQYATSDNNAQTEICVTAEWTGTASGRRVGNTFVYSRPLHVKLFSKMTSPAFTGGPVMTAEAVTGAVEMCSEPVFPEPEGGCEEPDPYQSANTNWYSHVKSVLEQAQLTSVNQPVYDRIRAQATAYLRLVEKDLYNTITSELANGLVWATRQLDGAKAAIDAYVQLAMPRALAGDEVLSAMLFGSERLTDQGRALRLSALYLGAANNPTGANVRLGAKALNDERVGLLSEAIAKYLGHYAGGHTDGSVAVRTTVNRLNQLVDVLRTPVLNITPIASEHSFGRVAPGSTKESHRRRSQRRPGQGHLRLDSGGR